MFANKETDDLAKDRAFSSHGQGDSLYNHATRQVKTSVLGLAVLLTLGFSAVELIGGLLSNSLALIGDAGHMATDAASLLWLIGLPVKEQIVTTHLVTLASKYLLPLSMLSLCLLCWAGFALKLLIV